MKRSLFKGWSRAGAAWLIALCGCTSTGLTGSPEVSGETHFLTRCDKSAACGSELSCVCGVCTRGCQASDECTALGPAATCAPSGAKQACGSGAPSEVCTLECAANAECAERLPGSSCSEDGTCTLSPPSATTADAATTAYALPAECVYAEGIQGQGAVPSTTAQCENVPLACDAMGDEADCLTTPLTRALEARIGDCGTYCGELEVAAADGCVTAVEGTVGTLAPVTSEEGLACVRAALLYTRWECVQTDGWMRFYLGSCTIP